MNVASFVGTVGGRRCEEPDPSAEGNRTQLHGHAANLDALDGRHKGAPQRFEAVEVEHCLWQFPVFNRTSDWPGDLLPKTELVQQFHQRQAQIGGLAFVRNASDAAGKFLDHQRGPGYRRGMNVARGAAFLLDVLLFHFRRFRVFNLIGLVRIARLFAAVDVQQF